MIPGTNVIFSSVRTPITFQFSRTDFNAGFVSSAVMSINLKTYIPSVATGDFFEMDSLWWRGSWATGYLPRQRWFIKYGTAYNPAYVNGGSNKNHQIQCRYAGSEIFQIAHRYTGIVQISPKTKYLLIGSFGNQRIGPVHNLTLSKFNCRFRII